MQKDSARLGLLPLNDEEMTLCLHLLKAPLLEENSRQKLVVAIGKYIESTFSGSLSMSTASERPLWEEGAMESLFLAQSNWRAIANITGVIPGPTWPSYDDFVLTNEQHELRFDLRAEADEKEKDFALEPNVGSVEDIFKWLFVRALATRQFSRFAHCAVCGEWVLKGKKGARRSLAKINFIKSKTTMKRAGTNQIPDIHINEWDSKYDTDEERGWFWKSLPMWPALCGSKSCKERFDNVVQGRSKPEKKHFPGLIGRNTQTLPPSIYRAIEMKRAARRETDALFNGIMNGNRKAREIFKTLLKGRRRKGGRFLV